MKNWFIEKGRIIQAYRAGKMSTGRFMERMRAVNLQIRTSEAS